jgi:3',5'-cyclic AMP phosphodiesterase CpdA
MKRKIGFVFLFILILSSICVFGANRDYKIAFLSDVHFMDIYGKFQNDAFKGLKSSKTGKNATIRTMRSQLNSTRLFNENYFAFLSALNDIRKRNIKYIVISGDFSDDGQAVNVKGLVRILDEYRKKYGIEFFVTFGNHDPNLPYTKIGGKDDYLSKNGKEQIITSDKSRKQLNPNGLPIVYTNDLNELGYKELIGFMGGFGLYPQKKYVYWETPFSNYNEKNYNYELALKESNLKRRTYKISSTGSGDLLDKEKAFDVIDGSYLVEPVEGLWLLAIDANVFIPKKDADLLDSENPDNFNKSGQNEYDKMFKYKQHTLEWIKSVGKRAEAENKTLIAFSHYPAIDFYRGASKEIGALFGEGNFQLGRVPSEKVGKFLAESGIKLHFAGHMHFNNTAVRKYKDGKFLVNIQVPSIAAYIPAYKIIEIENGNAEVETVILKNVDRFNELFEHYKMEHEYLEKSGDTNNWNINILNSKNYLEFTTWHIEELTRLRFLPNEWPSDIKKMLFGLTGEQMLIISQLKSNLKVGDTNLLNNNLKLNLSDPKIKNEWNDAKRNAEAIAEKNGLTLKDFKSWNGYNLAVDFYKLRNADHLALSDISAKKLKEYSIISMELRKVDIISLDGVNINGLKLTDLFAGRFKKVFAIMDKFKNSPPSIDFEIDMNNGNIKAD